MKKWIIIILAVMLTIGAGFVVPLLMNHDEVGTVTVTPEGGAISTEVPTETYSTVKETVATPEVKDTKANAGTVKDTSGEVKSHTPNPGKVEENDKVESPPTYIKGEQSTPYPDVIETPTNVPASTKNESWVEAKIREHRDEIYEEDLDDFRRIYSRVDIGYVQSIAKDGYTDEELEQLKTYLRSTLGGDYNRAKELFYNYSYLLEED